MSQSVSRMSLRLDFTWDKPVLVEQDLLERLCGELEGRAENFLVVHGMGIYQSGLDDVTVDAGRLD
jgi:hypothetical protein